MIKIRVNKVFQDKYTGTIYEIGQEVEVTEERYNELKDFDADLVTIVKDAKKGKNGKGKEDEKPVDEPEKEKETGEPSKDEKSKDETPTGDTPEDEPSKDDASKEDKEEK